MLAEQIVAVFFATWAVATVVIGLLVRRRALSSRSPADQDQTDHPTSIAAEAAAWLEQR